jgi:hypothetical protein
MPRTPVLAEEPGFFSSKLWIDKRVQPNPAPIARAQFAHLIRRWGMRNLLN